MKLCYALYVFLLLVLAGCDSGAVVFAPPPPTPDVSPLQYQHPSGAFALVVPRNWSLHSQHLTTFASAAFAPPHSSEPLVLVAVVNLGRDIDGTEMGDLMFRYQTQIRPDLARYREQERQAMGDGSWRMTGLRDTPGGATQQVNTFIQRSGPLLSVTEVTVPADPARLAELQTLINTLQLNPQSSLPVAGLDALSGLAVMELEVLNVTAWTSASGVFFITGEVVNRGTEALAAVPVRAVLTLPDGTGVVEAVDTVMGHVLPPGGFAPFSLRFGQGQPPGVDGYMLTVGGEGWQPGSVPDFAGSEAMNWTDRTEYNQAGHLVVLGEILNTGGRPLTQLRAMVTFFDETQHVIAAGYAEASPASLPAGGSATYSILVPDIGGLPSHYIVNVQALTAAAP